MKSKGWVLKSGHRCTLALHSSARPSDSEWGNYIEDCRALVAPVENSWVEIVSICFSDGGRPNLLQRKEIYEMITATPPRCLLVTENRLVLGVSTILSWRYRNKKEARSIHTAAPVVAPQAMVESIGLTRAEVLEIMTVATELKGDLQVHSLDSCNEAMAEIATQESTQGYPMHFWEA